MINKTPVKNIQSREEIHTNNLASIEYNSNSPPLVLRSIQYALINSANTLFQYDSFWSLIFLISSHSQDFNIIRSFLTVRLMREINGRVAFMPSNAVQIGDKDFDYAHTKDEQLIHLIAKTLDKWNCESKNFKTCVISCINYLASNIL